MKDNNSVLLRAIILSGLTIILIGGFLVYQNHKQNSQMPRSSGTKEFMEEGIEIWNGERYRKTPAVFTFLLGGIDKVAQQPDAINSTNYRSGGQADFLMLIAIDHTNKQIHRLQINRDAMTDVVVLGVFGQEVGTRVMQVCLSHAFGATKEDNARYTVKAVRNIMNNLEIYNWYMVDYTAVNILSDLLGGIRVTIPEDMTSVDPSWVEGADITLEGTYPERFVRERLTIGEGTNAERMNRQRVFMDSAVEQTRQAIEKNSDFGTELLSSLRNKSETNLSDIEILDIINVSKNYEVLPVDYLDGIYKVGASNFIEFYPDEDSSQDWIIRNLYSKVQ